MADGDKIKQVFWNFCENAVRAMKTGGVLTVSLEQIGDDWQISFADTGPGMSPQMIEKIFEPFQSQFEGGTGLGLAIVYQIVQAHEGKVWARSKLGRGQRVRSALRRLRCRADAQSQPAGKNSTSVRNGRKLAAAAGKEVARMGNILVCDDERSICEMLDIALRRDGHKVETVKSGEDAKRKLDSALCTTWSSPTSRCRIPMASKCCATRTRSRPTPQSS